ncbi:hypothetical protein LIER_18627 [Lithospermum erythrorhizon]|uniref:Uncharacterized protein n=1 Tax=Lithospermum erythrorhizon TaxID=34254 RepID=A0AAV3QHT3_LITER
MDDREPNEDTKYLGGGTCRFKVSEDGAAGFGDQKTPSYPPSFGPLHLEYSSGAIILKQNSRNCVSKDLLSPLLSEAIKESNGPPILNKPILTEQKETILNRTIQTEEADLIPTLKFFNFQKVGTQVTTEGLISTMQKGKAILKGPGRKTTPSKKRFHPYVDACYNGSQSKKPSLFNPGLDGSTTPCNSVEAAEGGNYILLSHHIEATIKESRAEAWRLVGFYGHHEVAKRKLSWNLLCFIIFSSVLPTFVIGDFNEVFFNYEHVSQTRPRPQWHMNKFCQVAEDCGIFYVGFSGFTSLHSTRARLDRGLASKDWIEEFSDVRLMHLTSNYSDHLPLLLIQGPRRHDIKRGKPRFRFESSWYLYKETTEVVKKAWNKQRCDDSGINLFTCIQNSRLGL